MKRGLSRTEAAEYIGIGTTKFDELVEERRMLNPLLVDKRKVWDVRELDEYFERLPRPNPPNSFEVLINAQKHWEIH